MEKLEKYKLKGDALQKIAGGDGNRQSMYSSGGDDN